MVGRPTTGLGHEGGDRLSGGRRRRISGLGAPRRRGGRSPRRVSPGSPHRSGGQGRVGSWRPSAAGELAGWRHSLPPAARAPRVLPCLALPAVATMRTLFLALLGRVLPRLDRRLGSPRSRRRSSRRWPIPSGALGDEAAAELSRAGSEFGRIRLAGLGAPREPRRLREMASVTRVRFLWAEVRKYEDCYCPHHVSEASI